ncbi:tetratricopeptide repeat protein [Aurantiacibacter odishensis]|uniref:tetratricopeptide repeat protein n=1 Tax=Aurantiacibacter odishensis TaxID=1155476 RepID=UPI000E75F3B6|nr:tetratricopeptide repeat protein [Aurantiacibacter odishensis]
MLRAFRTTRNKSIRGTVAGFALAIALAGGVSMGSAAVTSEAAQAQDNSRGFVEAYQPVAAMVQGETPDVAGARAAIPTLIAAIETPADRNVAGNLILNIGNQLSEPALQRQGLELMLESGLVAPEQVGQFNWFVGSLAFNAGDYAAARTALQAAVAAGYSDPEADATALVAESYAREDNYEAAYNTVMEAVAAAEAAGTTPREGWLLSTLQRTYNNDMREEALTTSEALVRHHANQTNWVNTLQVVNALYELDPEVRVDLYRLMRSTDALTQRQEFVRYIEDLDPRVMSNEVQDVLALGMTAGVFDSADPYYTEVKGIVDTRAPQDRSGIEGIVSDGESGDSLDAMSAGDVLYSLDDFARAEGMYRMALEKGADANTANTRIGIAQVEQGNYAAALETFGMVDGNRAPVARMWAAYAASMM